MILDRLDNSDLYCPLNPGFAQAFAFLQRPDLATLEVGDYPLQGREVFAIVSDYSLRPLTERRLEAHRRYIDIQYLVCGAEQIGWAPFDGQVVATPYHAENDVMFYEGGAPLFPLAAGLFAIFYPHDLHMPGLGSTNNNVRKVVVKVDCQCLV